MKVSLIYKISALFVFLLLAAGAARASLPVIMEERDVLPYLEKMISWHRAAVALDTSPEIPRELILKNTLQQHTVQALDGSFAFARALAEILPAPPKPVAIVSDKPEKGGSPVTLNQAIALANQEIEQLKTALSDPKNHETHASLNGQLKLAQEHLTLLKAVAETIGVTNVENENLSHKVDELASTITEVDAALAAAPGTTAAAQTPSAPASGIVGLATKIYFFYQEKSAVKSLLNDTNSLANDNKERTQLIRNAVKNILEEGKTLGSKPVAKPDQKAAPAEAAAQPSYDDLVTQMKKLSKVAIGLSQANKSLTLCTIDLSDWTSLISHHIRELLGNLLFRLSLLALVICVAFVFDTIARKAIRRYVRDRRRKDQLRVVRKILLTIIVLLILFLGFFTDLSSLATFAGLITAGIAFAMKDMILSVIAYFQFFSSSDIRPGDSITIAGVTGRITTIGMLRFYMMEMERSDAGFLPTGRVVGFANNILFQPMPFFRQTPGTNFVWNEIDISLAPTIDHEVAYKKLNDILAVIYAKHQGVIRSSEEALQKISPFKLDVAVPQTYFRFTNLGIVFVIRYAVERDVAQSIHLQMTSELIAAVRKDPDLKVLHIS